MEREIFYRELINQYELDLIEKNIEIEHLEFMIKKLRLDKEIISSVKENLEELEKGNDK